MKTLILLRHAKSSWDFPELSDYERPLNSRGRRDAPRMGKWFKNNIGVPELILASPSVRTLATISKLGHELGIKGNEIETEERLYHASPETLEAIVSSCPNTVNSLLIVSHNPGLTDFANKLCPEHSVSNIPTCGVFALRLHTGNWKNFTANQTEFLFFQYPKNLG